MWGKERPLFTLGVQTGVATVEINIEIIQKARD